MEFDLPSFVNLVLSSLIAMVSGWAVSHLYWKRSASVERILKELKDVLPHYLHPMRYPQFYSTHSVRIAPNEELPEDSDIPHVRYAIYSTQDIRENDEFDILLAIVDTGRNFENPGGLQIRDHMQREVTASFAGLGFTTATILSTPRPSQNRCHFLVCLKDTIGKEMTQTFSFSIASRSNT